MKQTKYPRKHVDFIFFKTLIVLLIISLILAFQNKNSAQSNQASTPKKDDIKIVVDSVTPELNDQYQYQSYGTPTPTKVWGVSQQLDAHTYTINVGSDPTMATPQDIFSALNHYRQVHNVGTLSWDSTLASYAQSRTDSFQKAGDLDDHAGFNDYLNNQNGFQKLGYANLGENSSIGYRLSGVHLIEWIYASDQPHNENQLNSSWSDVGIGVSGTATDLIFGGEKL